MAADIVKPEDKAAVPAQSNLPVAEAPTERKSQNIKFWDYAKNIAIVALVTKGSAIAGYFGERLLPDKLFPKGAVREIVNDAGKKIRPFAGTVAMVTGAAGGFVEGWRRWKKIKTQQLGVQDINTELYKELDPKHLQAEVEQNQRIQDGLQQLTASPAEPVRGVEPRAASFAQAALKDKAAQAELSR